MATLACLLRRWVVVFMDAVCSYRSVASAARSDATFAPVRRSVLGQDAAAATNGDGAMFTVRSPAAVACALLAPRQLGIGRAYVAGLLGVDDLDAALDLLADWQPPPLHRSIRARLALAAVCARGLTLPPRLPAAGLRPRGRRHSPPRDARAARHRYDVSNEFFALFLALADRHEHRACRSIPARREDAGGGPPGEARVRLRQARARARRACASAAAAAAGAASRSTVLPLAALSWSGSLGPSPRRASRSTGRRGRASPTGSRSA